MPTVIVDVVVNVVGDGDVLVDAPRWDIAPFVRRSFCAVHCQVRVAKIGLRKSGRAGSLCASAGV